jgi:polyhydroxyalkanoate synthesis regulator phasin
MIDQINYKRSIADDHTTANEMKAKALEQLNAWKTIKIALVTSIYDEERIRVEQIYDQCIAAKTKIQNRIFEALNAHSNTIEKKKNIHPNDLLPLKQKLDELVQGVQDIEKSIHANLTDIVDNIELPQISELKRLLETLPTLKNRVNELQSEVKEKNSRISKQAAEIGSLQSTIFWKDTQLLVRENELRACRPDSLKRGQMSSNPTPKPSTYGLK